MTFTSYTMTKWSSFITYKISFLSVLFLIQRTKDRNQFLWAFKIQSWKFIVCYIVVDCIIVNDDDDDDTDVVVYCVVIVVESVVPPH